MYLNKGRAHNYQCAELFISSLVSITLSLEARDDFVQWFAAWGRLMPVLQCLTWESQHFSIVGLWLPALSDLSWLTFYYKNQDLKCSTNYFISEKVKFCIFSVTFNKVNSTFNVLNIIDLKLNNKVIYLVKQRNFILICVLLVLLINPLWTQYIGEYSHSTSGKDIIILIFSYIYYISAWKLCCFFQ